jgi:hypothetical protein
MKVDHFWPRPRGRFAGRHLATVLGETWWPSLANSPAMISSPHRGSSLHIRRIRAWVSASMGGRPTGRRERRCQRNLQRARCHRRTVSGRTMATAARSMGNTLVMAAMASRSRALSRGYGAARCRTMTCVARHFRQGERCESGAAQRVPGASRSRSHVSSRQSISRRWTTDVCRPMAASSRGVPGHGRKKDGPQKHSDSHSPDRVLAADSHPRRRSRLQRRSGLTALRTSRVRKSRPGLPGS